MNRLFEDILDREDLYVLLQFNNAARAGERLYAYMHKHYGTDDKLVRIQWPDDISDFVEAWILTKDEIFDVANKFSPKLFSIVKCPLTILKNSEKGHYWEVSEDFPTSEDIIPLPMLFEKTSFEGLCN